MNGDESELRAGSRRRSLISIMNGDRGVRFGADPREFFVTAI
jgi:hypothetical protein